MGFTWDSREMNRRLNRLPKEVEAAVTLVVEFQATRGEALMKTDAPWTDRTGAARSGLFTNALHFPGVQHQILFSHSVPYGIWLEVANEERFAVILSSVETIGTATMEQLQGLFGRLK